jgi:hypothetical protein
MDLSEFFSIQAGLVSRVAGLRKRFLAGEVGGRDEEAGSRSETFFANQMKSVRLDVRIPTMGDFLVEGKYLFEIGGKGKEKNQIERAKNAFVVRDGSRSRL